MQVSIRPTLMLGSMSAKEAGPGLRKRYALAT